MEATKRPFMLIDDNDIDLFLNKKLLRVSGITDDTISFLSAREALKYLEENILNVEKLPAIILLDIQMPDINGFQFLEFFDKLPESLRENIKIIMLSSTIDPIDLDRAHYDKAVLDILKKPMDTQALKQILVKRETTKAA